MTVRQYIDNAPQTTLTGAITNSATSIVVTSLSGFPASFPFAAVLDIGNASAEIILVTAGTGTTLTVTRNYDGQGALSHAAGATFDHSAIAKDYQEANTHVNATSGVHGVAGALVGTTDTQTLSAKTLSAPKFTGTATTGLALTGTVAAGGDVTGTHVGGIIQPTTFTTTAARDTAIPTPTAGQTVFITADPTFGAGLTVYDGTQWVSQMDTGWLSSGGGLTVTPGAGFSLTATSYRKDGKRVYLNVICTRSGADINAGAYNSAAPGNFTDQTVFSLAGTGWLPVQTVWATFTASTTSGAGDLASGGGFQIQDMYPSSTITAGDVVRVSVTYPV